jgi:hypothetical protein
LDIDLNPKIGPDYMLRGRQKTVVTPGKNQKRYLAGALNAKTGKLTWVEWDRKDSDLFILQLWQLVGRDYPKVKRVHIILDNYSIHSSQRTQIALAALGDRVRLHFLPHDGGTHGGSACLPRDTPTRLATRIRNPMCRMRLLTWVISAVITHNYLDRTTGSCFFSCPCWGQAAVGPGPCCAA